MSLKYAMESLELLDDLYITGGKVTALFNRFEQVETDVVTVEGDKGTTDFIEILIKGTEGKTNGGAAPTLGICGRLGGIGARPSTIGLVSDADGAIAAVATAMKLADMTEKGDRLLGDVLITTHICPTAPTQPHEPVDFMGSPVDSAVTNQYEVKEEMDAILSLDTTKGNRVINHRGIAISPTVKAGYILKFSNDLVRIMEQTTGELAKTFAITTQDITPYGNDVYHINSILQPSVATDKPVVGVALVAESAVPGCATGASHEVDIAECVRFSIEVAKAYGEKKVSFYDEKEFAHLQDLYGSLTHFQTQGK